MNTPFDFKKDYFLWRKTWHRPLTEQEEKKAAVERKYPTTLFGFERDLVMEDFMDDVVCIVGYRKKVSEEKNLDFEITLRKEKENTFRVVAGLWNGACVNIAHQLDQYFEKEEDAYECVKKWIKKHRLKTIFNR
jgi:hypothetical protein